MFSLRLNVVQKLARGSGTVGLIFGENRGVFGVFVEVVDPVVDTETGVAGVVEA